MIFRRPYAFFIKYFRLINLVLSILVLIFIIKLNNLHNLLNNIYLSNISNYNYLNEEYIGFWMFFLIIIISTILFLMILLLKRKKKPYKDYLFLLVYNIVIIIYLFVISDLFFVLLDGIVEQNKLKLYSDISMVIFLPQLYFFIKYFLIAIGFNLNKFDFAKDINELKAEDSDNEEVELIFDKNTYKYKRGFRKWVREFKYYILENKLFVFLIGFIIFVISLSLLSRFNKPVDTTVKMKESFIANSLLYTVNDVYETKYDKNNKILKNEYKFVIANVNVKNLSNELLYIDLKNIRLFFGKEFSYANNYFINSFLDLGTVYNNQALSSGKQYNFLLLFQVPIKYNSNNYKIKFYDGLSYDEGDANGVYKTLSVNVRNLDNQIVVKSASLGENVILNQKKYGNSNLTINNYSINGNYVIENNNGYEVIKSLDIDHILFGINYDLYLEENTILKELNKTNYEFFTNYLKFEYIYNGNKKTINNVNLVKSNINNKLFISVPSEVKNCESISLIIKLRNLEIIYKLK